MFLFKVENRRRRHDIFWAAPSPAQTTTGILKLVHYRKQVRTERQWWSFSCDQTLFYFLSFAKFIRKPGKKTPQQAQESDLFRITAFSSLPSFVKTK